MKALLFINYNLCRIVAIIILYAESLPVAKILWSIVEGNSSSLRAITSFKWHDYLNKVWL